MKTLIITFAINLLFLFSCNIYAGNNKATIVKKTKQITVPSNYTGFSSPYYNLIFSDEFYNFFLEPTKWVKSSPGNDGTINCTEGTGVYAADPNLVGSSGNTAKLKISNDDYDGCAFSASEIKTFGHDWGLQTNIYFPKDAYLEVRARLPIGEGIGSAAWLYNPNSDVGYSEIDLWETDAQTNLIYMTHHWDKGFPNGQDREFSSEAVEVFHGFGSAPNPYDLSNNFVTYGLKWNDHYITWYINGKIARVMDLTASGTGYKGRKPASHMFFRLSTGSSLDDVKPKTTDLPDWLEVDYVRVWVIDGKQTTALTHQPSMCNTDPYLEIDKHYFPQVLNQWNIPTFKNAIKMPSTPWKEHWQIGLGANNQILPGWQTLNFSTTQFFPSGHQEVLASSIFVEGHPTQPIGQPVISQYNNTTFFQVELLKSVNVPHQISIDGGNTWKWASDKSYGSYQYATYGPLIGPPNTFDIRARVIGKCGVNDTYAALVSLPSSGYPCPNCPQKDLTLESGPSVVVYVVYDMLGQLVHTTTKSTNIRNLTPGIYIEHGLDASKNVISSRKIYAP